MTAIHFAGLGTLINVAGIIIGGLLGLFGGKFLTAKIQKTLQDACALAVIFLGADGALKNLDTMLLIASLIGGGLIGEVIDIDGKFERFGIWPALVRATTVCIGAMSVIGAINDRLLHDPTILIAKSAITFCAGFLEPFMTELALANLSTIGSILIFAVGVNLLFPDKKIRVANLLPALIIACLWR